MHKDIERDIDEFDCTIQIDELVKSRSVDFNFTLKSQVETFLKDDENRKKLIWQKSEIKVV